MLRHYTRACNFYYGSKSKFLVKQNKSLPLNGNHEISFDKIDLISRKSKNNISIHEIKNLSKFLKKKSNCRFKDFNFEKKKFCKLKFSKNT